MNDGVLEEAQQIEKYSLDELVRLDIAIRGNALGAALERATQEMESGIALEMYMRELDDANI